MSNLVITKNRKGNQLITIKMDPSGRDSRYNLNYSMSIGLSMGENPDIYGNSNATLARPPSGLGQTMNRSVGLMSTNTQCGTMSNSRGIKRTSSDCFDDRAMGSQNLSQLEGCTGVVPDVVDDSYTSLQKKSPPANGKKTKGRVKIKMEYIDNKLRRYTTFSKRKTGIMKKVIPSQLKLCKTIKKRKEKNKIAQSLIETQVL